MFRVFLTTSLHLLFFSCNLKLYSQQEITPLPLDKLSKDSLYKIIREKEATGSKKELAVLYAGIYSYYLYSDKRDSAFKYIIKAEENAYLAGDSDSYYYIQLDIGEFYARLDFEKAKPRYEKALQYYTKIKNYARQATSLGGLSYIYELKKDTVNQLKYLDLSEKFSILAKDTFNIVGANFTRAEILMNTKQLDSAILLFTENMLLIDHAKTFGRDENIRGFWKGWHLNKLADCYYRKKNYTLSIKYLEEALSYNNLTANFDGQNAFRSRFLINNFIQTGQKDSAIKYVDDYYNQTLKTLMNINPEKLTEISIKYETEKKQREIAELQQRARIQELTVQSQKKLTIAFIVILIFAALTSFFIIRNIKQSRKTALEVARKEMVFKEHLHKQKELEIRNRISRDLHDDVGATLSSVKAYSEILKDNPDNPIIAELIKENAAEMIDRLEIIAWATNPQHDNFKSLQDAMLKFARPLLYSKNIQLNFQKDSIEENFIIPGEARQNIFLVFKEAVNNIVKHADANECCISLFIQNQKFTMQIKDNGKGCNGTIHDSGNGLKNMQKRAEEMNGNIVIETAAQEGTVIIFFTPLPFKNTRFMG